MTLKAPPPRTLLPGQRCRVMVMDAVTGASTVVLDTDELLLEAPNWAPDGRLILNGDGVLWSLDPAAGALDRIVIEGVPDLNNDHVLAPESETVYVSADDWHIYVAPLAGGSAVRITPDHDGRLHFLHGVSPDGTTLAYTGLTPEGDAWWARAEIFTISVDGSSDARLAEGGSPADGSEYSPDGAWLYFNTERFEERPGHAQIARMRPDGTEVEQLTFDEHVNWFPHLSPDGTRAVHLSYPPGTEGHPADLEVRLRLVEGDRWADASTVATLPGGQGTINVNSWAPDSRRFAYVEYPIG